MALDFLKKNNFINGLIQYFGNLRAEDIKNKIICFLDKKEKILDIGSGTCQVDDILIKKGFKVQPLDVKNLSFVKRIKPKIYDGSRIPFKSKFFGSALLLTVLHHTKNPESILKEAKRVSKRIIIMEDIILNKFHGFLTYLFDSIINLEFFNHPHSNKSDEEWKKLFKKMNLKLVSVKYNNFFVMRLATYCVEA
jgi:ubiquinone/menaquinone biosynthesis C-methylase UbiE